MLRALEPAVKLLSKQALVPQTRRYRETLQPSSPVMYNLLLWRGKKKKKERKENEKDVLSPAVETGEETGDQHGVQCLQYYSSPLQTAGCRGSLSVRPSVRPSVRRLPGWKGPAPPEWLFGGSSVTKLPRCRGKANMLQQAGKL